MTLAIGWRARRRLLTSAIGLCAVFVLVSTALSGLFSVGMAFLVGQLSGAELVWSLGRGATWAIAVLLIVAPVGLLLALEGNRMLGLERLDDRLLATSVGLAFVCGGLAYFGTDFTASSQRLYFVVVALKASALSAGGIGLLYAFRQHLDRLEYVRATAERTAQADAFVASRVAGRPPLTQTGASWSLGASMLALPLVLYGANVLVTAANSGDLAAVVARGRESTRVCEQYRELCELHSALVQVERSARFPDAVKRSAPVLVLLQRAAAGPICRNAHTQLANAYIYLSGEPLSLGAPLMDTHRKEEALEGANMFSDPHIFFVRYVQALEFYNAAVVAMSQCSATPDPAVVHVLAI